MCSWRRTVRTTFVRIRLSCLTLQVLVIIFIRRGWGRGDILNIQITGRCAFDAHGHSRWISHSWRCWAKVKRAEIETDASEYQLYVPSFLFPLSFSSLLLLVLLLLLRLRLHLPGGSANHTVQHFSLWVVFLINTKCSEREKRQIVTLLVLSN